MPSPIDELLNLPGEVGDTARTAAENARLPGEMPGEYQDRLISTAETQRRATNEINRIKGRDLAARKIPSYTDPAGNVTPVTDATGAVLTNFDAPNNIAYDSKGKAMQLNYGETGPPAVEDALAGVPVTTDPKTGNQYKIRRGLPWEHVGTDPDIEAKNLEKEKIAAVTAAAAAVGHALTLDERQLKRDEVDYKARKKKLVELVPGLEGQDGADEATLRKRIDDHFNRQYATDAANDRRGWFGGDLTPEAKALRAKIDADKGAANKHLDDIITVNSALAGRKQHVEAQQAQNDALQRQKVDAELAKLKAAGVNIPGLQGPGDAGNHSPGVPGATPAPATTPAPAADTTIVPVAPGEQPAATAAAAASATGSAPSLYDRAKNFVATMAQGLLGTAGEVTKSPWGDPTGAAGIGDIVRKTVAGKPVELADFANALPLGMNAIPHIIQDATGRDKRFVPTQKLVGDLLANDIPGVITDPAFKDNGEAKVGRFVGGVIPYVVAPQATIPLLFSTGYQGQYEAATAHGAKPETAAGAGLIGGAVNSVLGIPFMRAGRVIAAVFGKAAPSAVQAAFDNAYAAAGAKGVADLLSAWTQAVRSMGTPAAQATLKAAAIQGLQGVIKEISMTVAQRAGRVATRAAVDAAVFGSAQAGQNLVAKELYKPEQEIMEGVPEAAGTGAVFGTFFGTIGEGMAHRKAAVAKYEIASAMRRQGGKPPNIGGPGAPPAGPTSGNPPAGPAPPTQPAPGGGSPAAPKPKVGPVPGAPSPTGGTPPAPPAAPGPGQPPGPAPTAPPTGTPPGAAGPPVSQSPPPAPASPSGGGTPPAPVGPVPPAPSGGAPAPTGSSPTPGSTPPTGQGTQGTSSSPQPTSPTNVSKDEDMIVTRPEVTTRVAAVEKHLAEGDHASARRVANQLGDFYMQDNPDDPPEGEDPAEWKIQAAKNKARNDKLAALYTDLQGRIVAAEKAGKPARVVGPALLDASGKIVAQGKIGQTHAQLKLEAAKRGEDLTDAEHGFVDDQGNPLTRDQATTVAEAAGQRLPGTKGPLHSEHLKPDTVDTGAHGAATSPENDLPEPTDPQKEAGNYKVGRVRIGGMDISIEHPAGTKRAAHHEKPLTSHYGYIRGTTGKDGDQIDVFIKPSTPTDYSGPVYVVNQTKKDGTFDEHKAIIGAGSKEEASKLYHENYPDDWKGGGDVAEFKSVESFKEWAQGASRRLAPAKGDKSDIKSVLDDVREIVRSVTDEAAKIDASNAGPLIGAFQHTNTLKLTGREAQTAAWSLYAAQSNNPAIKNLSEFLEKTTRLEELARQLPPIKKAKPKDETQTTPGKDAETDQPESEGGDVTAPKPGKTEPGGGGGTEPRPKQSADWLQPATVKASFEKGIEPHRQDLKDLEIAVRERAESDPQFDGGIGINSKTFEIVYDPKRLGVVMAALDAQGVDAEKWLHANQNEEYEHGLDMVVSGHEFGKLHAGFFDRTPDSIKDLVREVYPDWSDSTSLGVEMVRMLQQAMHRGELTESHSLRATEAAKLMNGLEAWDLPSDLAAHLLAIDRLRADVPGNISWAVDASDDGGRSFARNGMRFATKAAAEAWGKDLESRWMAMTDFKVRASGDPINQGDYENGIVVTPLEQSTGKTLFQARVGGMVVGQGYDTHDAALQAARDWVEKNKPEEKEFEAPNFKAKLLVHDFAMKVAEALTKGTVNRVELGKMAKGRDLSQKQIDEAAELGVVLAARKIIQTGKGGPRMIFAALVDLYEAQPNLTAKTSTSKVNQAYSSPVPLGWATGVRIGLAEAESAADDTAGNGALTLAGKPKNIVVNEIDPTRINNLRAMGFKEVTTFDATEKTSKADVKNLNPPFGSQLESGDKKEWELYKDANGEAVMTPNIDQAIALKSLSGIPDNGKASIIMGGKLGDATQRAAGYKVGGTQLPFWHHLYENYKVVDHFTIAGDLYGKQGAKWPVDVIIIEGRGKSALPRPWITAPAILDTWEAVGDRLLNEQSVTTGKPGGGGHLGTPGGKGPPAGPPKAGGGDKPAPRPPKSPGKGGGPSGPPSKPGKGGGDIEGSGGKPGDRPQPPAPAPGKLTPEQQALKDAAGDLFGASNPLSRDLRVGVTGYEKVSDNLLGFRREGPNKGFGETRYPYTLNLEISLDGGKTWATDSIKGLNRAQATERARRNWDQGVMLRESDLFGASDPTLKRVGHDIDKYEGKAPDVDWKATDVQAGVWTRESVAKFLDVPADKHIYRAMVDLSELKPERAERSMAEETRKGKGEIESMYLDEAEAMLEDYTDIAKNEADPWRYRSRKFEAWKDELPWNPKDGYDQSDVEILAREMQARSEESSYPDEELSFRSNANKGFPPVVITRNKDGSLTLNDGNHRVDHWKQGDYDLAPAWINDEKARLIGASDPTRRGRIADLEQANRDLKAGKITREEHEERTRSLKPVAPLTKVPTAPSDEQMRAALTVDKAPLVGAARDTSVGKPVGLRIDIPAFKKSGTYVVTIHEQAGAGKVGKRIGYDGTAAVNNPRFFVTSQDLSQKIATGEVAKAPLATIEGNFASSQTAPADAINWTQVSYDPERHGYFYDRATGQPVVRGKFAVLVGNTAFVKDPVFGEKSDFVYSSDPTQGTFDAPIPPEKMGAMIPLTVKLAATADTPEKFVAAILPLGPKAPAFTQSLWFFAKGGGAQGPDRPAWADIYKGLEPKAPDEQPPEAPKDEAPKITTNELTSEDNAFQGSYKPRSKSPLLNPILTPVNLRDEIEKALDDLEKRRGNIDDFALSLASSWIHGGIPELHEILDGGQIDAFALAVDKIMQDSALVNGDQTGMGKGRVAASIMTWAQAQGYLPVFITEGNTLYKAMIDDFADIHAPHMIPFFTNTDIKLVDADDNVTHRSEKGDTQKNLLREIIASGRLPVGTNVLFTSFHQLGKDRESGFKETDKAQMQRKRNRHPVPDGLRTAAMRRLAPNAVFVLDEVHNAAGDSDVNYRTMQLIMGWGPRNERTGTRKPRGVYYSSATFAKRADNIPIYAVTDLGKAVSDPLSLPEIFKNGGVAMQQVASGMLARGGQYIRREMDYSGIEFVDHMVGDPPTDANPYPEQYRQADSFTAPMRDIVQFSSEVQVLLDLLNQELEADGETLPNGDRVSDQLTGTEFADQIHLMVSQYLLAVKAKATAEEAIRQLSLGFKPVITMENTLETPYLDTLARGFEPNFQGLLHRYLHKSLEFTLKKPDGSTSPYRINLEQLMSHGDARIRTVATRLKDAFDTHTDTINLADVKDLHISPIDTIKEMIEEAGYTVGEITGRSGGVKRDGKRYSRKGSEKTAAGKNRTLDMFNNAGKDGIRGYDALILNRSGATGISAHAAPKFFDKKPRRMLIAQPNADISVMMQMYGRINRKGQLSLPMFYHILSQIAAEQRIGGALRRKLKNLKANTTSNQQGVEMTETPDLFNDYGDIAAYLTLEAHPEIVNLLQNTLNGVLPSRFDTDGKDLIPDNGGFYKDTSGEISIAPAQWQRIYFKETDAEFKAIVQHETEMGTNKLMVDALDLAARTMDSEVLSAEVGPTEFEAAANLETVETKAGRPPLPFADVEKIMQDSKEKSDKAVADWMTARTEAQTKRMQELDEVNRDRAPWWTTIRQQTLDRMERDRINITNASRQVGQGVLIDFEGVMARGVITEFVPDLENPLLPSRQSLVVHLNTSRRMARIPVSQMSRLTSASLEDMRDSYDRTIDRSTRRYMVTGNLIAGWEALKNQRAEGKIVTYTTGDGKVKTGILLPQNYNPGMSMVKIRDAAHLIQVLSNAIEVRTPAGLSIRSVGDRDHFEVRAPAARNRGGRYWREDAFNALMVGNQMIQQGSDMVGRIARRNVPALVDFINNVTKERLSYNQPPRPQGGGHGASNPLLVPFELLGKGAEVADRKTADILAAVVGRPPPGAKILGIVATPAAWARRTLAAKLAGTTIDGAINASIEFVKGQVLPYGKMPEEAAAHFREQKITEGFNTLRAIETMTTLVKGGTSQVLGFEIPKADANPTFRKDMWEVMTGREPITILPDSMQDAVPKMRAIITEYGHEVVLAGLLDEATRAKNETTYLAVLYKEQELKKLGLRGLGMRFRTLVLDRFKPRLSDAWAVVDKKTGKPINHTTGSTKSGPFRFDSQQDRDAYYASFLAQKVVSLLNAKGHKSVTVADLPKLALAGDPLHDLFTRLRDRVAERYVLNTPMTDQQYEDAGRITDVAIPLVKTLLQLGHDASLARVFNSINANPEWVKTSEEDGFTRLPYNARYGILGGRYVQEDIANHITELVEAPHVAMALYDGMLKRWKRWKTVYNPATHGRNVIGNFGFATLAGCNPLNPANAMQYWFGKKGAFSTLKGRNPDTTIEELYKQGVLGGDITRNELSNIMRDVLNEISPNDDGSWLFNLLSLRALRQFAMKAYRVEDDMFKVAAYLRYKTMGRTPEEAAAETRKWFPYYDNLPNSMTMKIARRGPMPFASFFYESTRIGATGLKEKPLSMLALLAIPSLITLYSLLRLGMDKKDRDTVIDAMRGKIGSWPVFAALMPVLDKQGRPVQWDLTNTIPYADTLGKRIDRGDKDPRWWEAMAQKLFTGNPVGNIAVGLAANEDPFTGRPLHSTGMTKVEDAQQIGGFVGKTVSPPLTPFIGTTWNTLAAPSRYRGSLEKRSTEQAAARALVGVDIRNAAPSVGKMVAKFKKERGLPDVPTMDDSTPRSRARERLYQALINDDSKAMATEMKKLDDLGASIGSPKAVAEFVRDRHPLRALRIVDRPYFMEQLSQVEKRTVNNNLEEYNTILSTAASKLLRNAGASVPATPSIFTGF